MSDPDPFRTPRMMGKLMEWAKNPEGTNFPTDPELRDWLQKTYADPQAVADRWRNMEEAFAEFEKLRPPKDPPLGGAIRD